MLGISQEILNKMAELDVPHREWTLSLMKLKGQKAYKAEEKLVKWLMSQEPDYRAVRIVKETLLPFLEQEAFSMYPYQGMMENLSPIETAEEAVLVGSLEMNNMVTEESQDRARALLRKLEIGDLVPGNL